MRSVVVVFPASMCAMMPMFRIFSRGTCRAMFFFLENAFIDAHVASIDLIQFLFVSRCSVRNRRITAFLCYPGRDGAKGKPCSWKVRMLGSWDGPTARFFVLTS